MVRRTARAKCPKCGSTSVVPIEYGLPGPEMERAAEAGRIELGGAAGPSWRRVEFDADGVRMATILAGLRRRGIGPNAVVRAVDAILANYRKRVAGEGIQPIERQMAMLTDKAWHLLGNAATVGSLRNVERDLLEAAARYRASGGRGFESPSLHQPLGKASMLIRTAAARTYTSGVLQLARSAISSDSGPCRPPLWGISEHDDLTCQSIRLAGCRPHGSKDADEFSQSTELYSLRPRVNRSLRRDEKFADAPSRSQREMHRVSTDPRQDSLDPFCGPRNGLR